MRFPDRAARSLLRAWLALIACTAMATASVAQPRPYATSPPPPDAGVRMVTFGPVEGAAGARR